MTSHPKDKAKNAQPLLFCFDAIFKEANNIPKGSVFIMLPLRGVSGTSFLEDFQKQNADIIAKTLFNASSMSIISFLIITNSFHF